MMITIIMFSGCCYFFSSTKETEYYIDENELQYIPAVVNEMMLIVLTMGRRRHTIDED